MARPKCPRRIGVLPTCDYFKPRGIPLSSLEEVALATDEVEALRLADLEGHHQADAAKLMGVSRQTFARIADGARRKVADALIHGKALRIEGIANTLPDTRHFACRSCDFTWEAPFGTGRPPSCPGCGGQDFDRAEGEPG
jgi:predicted DNA-binding protein (UPF0251 family)